MSSAIQYNPNPARVWSRVQNPCSVFNYKDDDPNASSNFARADYERRMLLKGNILQYKKNSSNLTKNQRYTQIAKKMWTNKKTWATQSDTYSNPNTCSLLRVNYNILDPSNNSFSSRSNPYGCPTNETQDGGTLVCNTIVNPCTQEVIKKTVSQKICNPTTDSNVPGPIQALCWNDGTQTWYPRQRYIMSSSGTKWPVGYKGLVSALAFVGPVLSVESMTCGDLDFSLSWIFLNSICAPITSFNIYQNGVLILNVPVSQTSVTIQGNPPGTYIFYVTSLSNTTESEKSNVVTVITQAGIVINSSASYTYIDNVVTITITQSSIMTFNCPRDNMYILCIGGGGGGAGGKYFTGGGSGGIGVVNTSTTIGNIFNITVGIKGGGGFGTTTGTAGTSSSVYNGIDNIITSTGGVGGGSNYGGSSGTSSSIYPITSYNGGKGGEIAVNGSNCSPISITTPFQSFSYGGGGGSGGYTAGGQPGNLSIGGLKEQSSQGYNGGSATETSYGSGGGAGGNKSGNTYNGGNGANGAVIIQFAYP